VGQVGYDSNVFYTQSGRTGDFVADGGPGLELLLPLGASVDLGGKGGVNYLYFVDTESQRRATWLTEAFLRFETPKTLASVTGSRSESFRRPEFEVDDRIFETNRRAAVGFRRDVGRNQVAAGFEARRLEVDEGQLFGGSDLARNLSRSTYRARLGFEIGLTPKTSLVIEADQQADRFLFESARDADSNRVSGGFRVESTTRLSGRAVAGARRFRARRGDVDRWFPYVAVALRYRLGPRTAMALSVSRDQEFSAFTADAGTQTSKRLTSELALGRHLWGPMEIRVFGGLRKLETDGAVELLLDDGSRSTGVRKDDEWYGGGNLGFRFRNWFRVGLEARYSDRNSSFADLGVDGLLLGVTVTATPGDLIDLVVRD
jgi:hypothetical protein